MFSFTNYNKYKNDFQIFLKLRKKYRGLFHCFSNIKSNNFIDKYHKNKYVSTNKLSYLAGLIDGEGHLKIEKHGTIRLIIGMCAKNTIYWLKKNFGGTVTIQRTRMNRKFYVWRLNQGKDLMYLLFLVIPFLTFKKEKLSKALQKLIKKTEKLHFTLHGSKYNKKEGYDSIR